MKRLLPFILFVATLTAKGQNLVPNSSFEDVAQCIDSGGSVNHCISWSNPTTGTPDILAVDFCDNYFYSINISLPNSPFFGFQQPRTGLKCAGIGVYSVADHTREYLQIGLLDTLKAGIQYCVEFYANLANKRSKYAIRDIGLHFSNDSVFVDTSLNNDYPIIYFPDNNINSNIYVTDTLNWVKISGIYIAHGGEKFIQIGNFSQKFATDTLLLYPSVNTPYTYYYIDDVTIYECDSLIGIDEKLLEPIKIYPNPTQDFISINLPANYKSPKLSIYNLTGQLISQKPIISTQIPITELGNGMYLFVIESRDKVVGRQKVVVTR